MTNQNTDDNDTNLDLSESMSESQRRSSFKQLATLFARYKEYTAQIESQLNHIQKVLDQDTSTTKEIELEGGITICIKFNNGVPQIPMSQAFAVNCAAVRLIEQLIETKNGVPSPAQTNNSKSLRPTLMSVSSIQDVLNNNAHLENSYDS
jgi:hypothetical protein